MEDELLPCVIADSAAFLKSAPLEKIAKRIFTISDVVGEIRDAATRQRLQVLPYTLEFREPSTESIKAVSEFAKKTGDFASLSAVDIRVMALTYQLEKEFCNSEHIKDEPVHKVEYVKGSGMNNLANVPGLFYNGKKTGTGPSENKQGEGEDPVAEPTSSEERKSAEDSEMKLEDGSNEEETENVSNQEDDDISEDKERESKEEESTEIRSTEEGDEKEVSGGEEEEEEEVEDDYDDGGGWITPKNISKIKKELGCEEDINCKDVDVKSACLTTDFAMQNVLIQMGLHVVSINGMLIKQARSYILKCYGCNKETTKMEKIFCPNCGNKTLKRVSVSVKDGTIQYHLPRRRRPMNLRGTKFPLPLPKGGRQADNIILSEDQQKSKQRLPKTRDSANPLDPDYIARSSPFSQKDVTSKAFNKGIHLKPNNRRNPNEGRRTKSRRK